MGRLRPLILLAAAALPSCAIYDAELLGEATAGVGSAASTGGTSSGGGGGGDPGGGGTGGTIVTPGGGGNGGTGGGSGGSGSGGGTGGDAPAGGTGGAAVVGLCEGLCLDHMNHLGTGAGWKNPAGSPANIAFNWGTYDDGLGSWSKTELEPPGMGNIMSPRADHPNAAGTTEKELHIAWTGIDDPAKYGIGVYVKLDSSGPAEPVNLTAPIAYSGVKFWAKLNGDGFSAFSVGLEDSASTPAGPHPKSASQFLTTEWQLYTLAFEDFTPAVLVDELIGVHFVMDPAAPFIVDFSIDDLYFYE